MEAEAQTPVEGELTQHEQDMINLVDSKEAEAVAKADPENAPEYQEPEQQQDEQEIDYKAKYEELLKSKEQPEQKPLDGLEVPEDTPETAKEVNDAVETTLTPEAMDKYSRELASDGVISENSYKELEAKGLSKEVVDAYIRGQQALQEAQTSKVYDTVGGKENYSEMIQWAKTTWDKGQIEAFNNAVNSGNESMVMFGVNNLKAQYEAAQGSPIPKRTVKGTSQGTPRGSKGYENKQEMFKAMRDPAYGKDPSYTKMVENRVALSNF